MTLVVKMVLEDGVWYNLSLVKSSEIFLRIKAIAAIAITMSLFTLQGFCSWLPYIIRME